MLTRLLVLSVASSLVLAGARTDAATTPQDLYAAALAREQVVRAALAAEDTSAGVYTEIHSVVAAYQDLVRKYPASGYSDNALWQAGTLSLDAFHAFGQEQDRTTGIRLLRLLTSEYPTSRLVADVPAQLVRVQGSSAAGPKAAAADKAQTGVAGAPSQPPSRQPRPAIATIKAIRREVLPDTVRVTIELDREVAFHDERILGPVRVFVDLPSTRPSAALLDKTLRFDGDNDVVHQIRIGRHPDNRTRVVLDAADVTTYSVYPLYEPYRLVIDCVRTPQAAAVPVNLTSLPKPKPIAARNTAVTRVLMPPPPLMARLVRLSALRVPTISPMAALPPAAAPLAAAPLASTPPAVTPPPVTPSRQPPVPASPPVVASTTAPPKNTDGGYSMARQLGLSVSRIVIDPGHGGHDPGAQGSSLSEAELVLDVALRVEKLLQQVPGVEVILTRRTDEYVPLPERTALANREGADLFLSIHANANASAAARGVETYFLNFASTMSAASVAARENAASGQAMSALPDFLKAIALNNKIAESRDFAVTVQDAMMERLRKSNKTVKDLGVKQAPFVVLIGAAMPSVLAEISFLTNPQEERLLRTGAYRQRIAEALVAAVQKYQTSLQNSTRVAQER
jgi:N-acetylmuramoyl-L-alanine amidase